MAKKSPSKNALGKKVAVKKAAAKKAAPAVNNFAAFALSDTEVLYPSDAVVLDCIRTLAGAHAVIESSFTLGGLNVNGTSLAGCINVKLGTKFKSSSFPPTMTVGACLLKVRAKVA